jgi:riboflavin biosynthesis pyrimidine reductase
MVHKGLDGQAWLVGRVTMQEMSRVETHPPDGPHEVSRSHHFAPHDANSFAMVIDRGGKTHFKGGDLYGDHVIVFLGSDVPDSHLAELAADGVSYIVSPAQEMDIAAMLETASEAFHIQRVILEGGAATNGALMAAGLVDEISFIVAPALDARRGSDRVVEHGTDGLSGKLELSLLGCERIGHGALHLRYAVSMPR